MRKQLVPLVLAGSLALVGAGCSNSRPYTDSEKGWAAGTVGCKIADIVTTDMVLKQGGHEQNKIYGSERPSDAQLVLGKSLEVAALYAGGEQYPEKRELLYQIGTFVSCGVAIHNYSQTKEGKNLKMGLSFKF